MSHDRIQDLVIKYSKSMGYNIEACQIPPEIKGSKFKPDAVTAAAIADVTMPQEFDTIMMMHPLDRHYTSLKYQLAYLFDVKDRINDFNQETIEYLLKEQYIQAFRRHLMQTCPIIKKDPIDQTENFWRF